MRFLYTRQHIFFTLICLLCLYIIYPYLLSFVIGITLAYLYEPIIESCQKKLNLKKAYWPWVFAIFVLIISFFSVIAPIYSIISTGTQQFISFVSNLEEELRNPKFINTFAQWIIDISARFGYHVSSSEIVDKGTEFIKKLGGLVASGAGNVITATPSVIIHFFVILLTWCVFLVNGKSYRRFILPKLIPWQSEREILVKTFSSVLKALIFANLLVSCIQAVLITTTLALFGIPRFALWGIVGFFMSFVPVIGTAPVMLGAATWCYFAENRTVSAIAILICSLIISFADNLLRPFFMKGGAELSFFWIFLAIIGGMSQFGIAGAVLGPVSFALFVATVRTLDKPSL